MGAGRAGARLLSWHLYHLTLDHSATSAGVEFLCTAQLWRVCRLLLRRIRAYSASKSGVK